VETKPEEQRDDSPPAEGSSTVPPRQEPLNRDSIRDMQYWAGTCAARHGWRTDFSLSSLPELIALMHSELSEALEEYREGHLVHDIYLTKDKEGIDKPEGIGIELADCVIRIMHFCHNFNIDLSTLISYKMEYNEKRPYRHGGKLI